MLWELNDEIIISVPFHQLEALRKKSLNILCHSEGLLQAEWLCRHVRVQMCMCIAADRVMEATTGAGLKFPMGIQRKQVCM